MVFLDRDGVINRDRPDSVKSWAEFQFIDGAVEALARLKKGGFRLVVVSNQSIIGRGLVSPSIVADINRRMAAALAQAGAELDGLYLCPHAPGDGCNCRKPKPGLILEAAEEMGLDLSQAWFIGDDARDIQAGQAAGLRTILVRTGKGALVEKNDDATPDWIADDLAGAADRLLRRP